MNRALPLILSLASMLILALGCSSSRGTPTAADPASSAPDVLAASLDALEGSLREAEQAIRAAPGYAGGSELERARGYEFLLRSLIQSLESELLQDPDYPYFRVLDFWLRGGGDNPDQRYAFSPIRGGEAYRIRGELGSARRVEIQLYAGQPWAASGRSVGYLTFEEIQVDPEGSFVVELVPGDATPGQLSNPADATTVFVRHIFDAWDERSTGGVHIDRVGFEGRRRPSATPDDTAQRIRNSATNFALRTKTWPAFVARRYVEARPPNALSPLVDTYALGGARGRWMATGHFEIPDGTALLVRMPATEAAYQAIQLTDLWFDSLEYGNQVSSLNTTQLQPAPNGDFYVAISATDPGYANWLDTGGLPRGTILMRYDGVHGEIPSDRHPSTELVDLEALPERIPDFAVVGRSERERVRAERRRHLQIRSHR